MRFSTLFAAVVAALARIALVSGVAAVAAVAVLLLARARPQDLPWTPLDLGDPVGLATAAKLAALDGPDCRALLARAGVRHTALPPRREGGTCGYGDGVRLDRGGARAIALRPAGPATACPLAAGLAMWEWQVVQPAALARFGAQVVGIDHFGTYACRRIGGGGGSGGGGGGWSEHAAARAIDVAGFRLADGRRVTVARDWRRAGTPAADFLHDVRDGACGLFATTLSPDFDAAHADHLHLDQAPRGATGWRACR